MTWLALSLALQQSPATAPATSWRRIYTSPGLHVGVGLALLVSSEEIAGGVTLQLTARAL